MIFAVLGGSTHTTTDTTSTTLTYLFWELTRHPTWQSRLRAELSAQEPWANGMPSYSDVLDLPVLAAVINEALRLHPAAPASLPRVVPTDGRVLNGVFIPEQVRFEFRTLSYRLTANHTSSSRRLWCLHNVIPPSVTRPYFPTQMHLFLSAG